MNKLSALISEPIGQFPHYAINNTTLLGASLVPGSAMDSTLGEMLNDLKSAFERLQLISANDAVVLFLALCSAPKFMHVMRSSPCASH